MNAGLDVEHASIHYYDGDYPSEEHSLFPENFDATTVSQGIRHDVRRYKELASQIGGPILELCCGTGRVAIPLAKAEFDVTGVDVSRPILEQFRGNLRRESQSVCQRITIVEQDITTLELDYDAYPLAIIAFNSLLLVTDFDSQLRALRRAAAHLCDGGLLVLDIVNPLCLKIDGDPLPKPFFTRKNPNSGNLYTRFAMSDPLDENQCQRLHGWYDEIEAGGGMTRRFYSLHWRPIYRFEVELMLKSAGCRIETVEGGHLGERFAARSPRMFIQARKVG